MDIASLINSQLSKITPIIEGFLTIGVTSEELQSHIKYFLPLAPKVLTKFPPDYNYPETISMFCFPKGAKTIKPNSNETENECFNFILTDENGSQVYCAAMIIYEHPINESDYLNTFKTENREHTDEKINSLIEEEDYSMLTPKSTFAARRSKSLLRPLKRGSIDSGNSKILIRERRSTQSILAPKCILLLSKYPFFEALKKILLAIHSLLRTHLSLPIESYLVHLFLLLPLPPRGCIEVAYQLQNSVILFKVPPVNQLPLYDCNMSYLFKSLSIPVILQIFTRLLIEDNVVFLSSSIDKLFSCSYTLTSLLYPFK